MWFPSVEAYEVRDGGTVIGRFFLDPFRATPSISTPPLFHRHGGRRPPIPRRAGLQLPRSGPMEHDQVETFFTSLATCCIICWPATSLAAGVGFNTELDFVEAPRRCGGVGLGALGARDLRQGQHRGRHPANLVGAMRKAREFGKGLWAGTRCSMPRWRWPITTRTRLLSTPPR